METLMLAFAIFILVMSIIYVAIQYIKTEQQNLLLSTLENAKSYAIFLNKSNKIIRATSASQKLLGVNEKELINKHISFIFEQEEKYKISQALSILESSRVEFIEDTTIKTNKGTAHILCRLIKLEELKFKYDKAVLIQDITSIVEKTKKVEEAEKRIKEYADLLHSSFDDSFVPSLIITQDGVITNYNKSFHALVQKNNIKTNQDTVKDVLQLDDYIIKEALSANKCFEKSVMINDIKKDLVFNIHKIQSSTDKEYVLCQIQDITKQKQAESLRRKLENKVLNSQKVEYLGKLASLISHEFNNSLMPIISFSKSIEKSLPTEMKSEKEKIGKVLEASHYAKNIISQISEIERIEYKETETVDLQELIDRCLAATKTPNNIQIEVNNHIDTPCTNANYEVLEKSLNNMLYNSIQAIKDKDNGKIELNITAVNYNKSSDLPNSLNKVNLEANTNYLRFEVKDNGVGISSETLDNIFYPFFTTKYIKKQLGTGLTYVYNAMEKFDIAMEVISKDNQGASIIAYFRAINTQIKDN